MIKFSEQDKTIEELKNVGNTNGRDVTCSKCSESWENAYIIDEFVFHQFNNYVLLDSQLDDPGGEETRIAELDGCPCCEGV